MHDLLNKISAISGTGRPMTAGVYAGQRGLAKRGVGEWARHDLSLWLLSRLMVKRVPTKGIHVTTIRLDDATLAALDKHAKAAAEGPRARSWLIQKIIAEWLKAQGDKVNLLGHTQGISE
jgi:hypothetical protein